jgi:hypothetical protein
LAPIVAELSVSPETIHRQAETIGESRAENRALLAHTEAEVSELTDALTLPRRLYRRWWLDWLILATLRVVAFALWRSR